MLTPKLSHVQKGIRRLTRNWRKNKCVFVCTSYNYTLQFYSKKFYKSKCWKRPLRCQSSHGVDCDMGTGYLCWWISFSTSRAIPYLMACLFRSGDNIEWHRCGFRNLGERDSLRLSLEREDIFTSAADQTKELLQASWMANTHHGGSIYRESGKAD